MKTIETRTIGNRPQNEDHPYAVFTVGDQVNMRGYSDVVPGTVVKVERNGSCVHVQHDNAELAEGEKPNILPGGFSGHCTNQYELKWEITRNENGAVEVFSLKKWRGRYFWNHFRTSTEGRNVIGKGWRKFYDYNF